MKLPVKRHHLPDEEPDVDERDGATLAEIEDAVAAGLCPVCRHTDHSRRAACRPGCVPCGPEDR